MTRNKKKLDFGTSINVVMLVCTLLATWFAYRANNLAQSNLTYERTASIEITKIDVGVDKQDQPTFTEDGNGIFLLETSLRVFFKNTGGKAGSLDYVTVKVDDSILAEDTISPDNTKMSQWGAYTTARYIESGEIAGPGTVIDPGNSKVLMFVFSPPAETISSHSKVELIIHTNSGQELPVILRNGQIVISTPLEGHLFYLPNPDGKCNSSVIAGQITSASGAPLSGVVVRLEGNGLDMLTISGTAPIFGENAFEFIVSDKPISAEFKITFLDQSGTALSKPITITTSNSCQENLIFINFIETR